MEDDFDLFALMEAVTQIVDGKNDMVTPHELESLVIEQVGGSRKSVKAAIKRLVEENRLEYLYQFGRTCLGPSFQRPVYISGRVMLVPPDVSHSPSENEIAIKLQHGVAFGTGRHPTTRLAVRGIEHFLVSHSALSGRSSLNGLDIGTGSGILAIVMAHMGIHTVLGLDVDPCCVDEARKNAELNDLGDRLRMSDRPLNVDMGIFDMVAANLRYPTLIALSRQISEMIRSGGGVVLSGFRPEEAAEIIATYTAAGFDLLWEDTEKNWGGAAFIRR